MSHKGDETRTFKIIYFVISEVLSYKTIKVIDVRVTFTGQSVMKYCTCNLEISVSRSVWQLNFLSIDIFLSNTNTYSYCTNSLTVLRSSRAASRRTIA